MQVCHYCFKVLHEGVAYPCQRCQLAWYCCGAHRSSDGFHRPGGPSCGVPWTAVLPEQAVLAARLAYVTQVYVMPNPTLYL